MEERKSFQLRRSSIHKTAPWSFCWCCTEVERRWSQTRSDTRKRSEETDQASDTRKTSETDAITGRYTKQRSEETDNA